MNDTHEEKELAIDTAAGLQSFLEYVNDAYTELTELIQEVAVFGRDMSKEAEVAYEIYEHLIESVAQYEMVLERGGVMRGEDVATLQTLYSELVTIIDTLSTNNVTQTPAPVREPESFDIQKQLTVQHTESVPQVFAETSATLNDLLVAATKLAEKGDVLLHKYEEVKDVQPTTQALDIPKFYYTQLGVSVARAKKIKDEIFALSQQRDNNRSEPILQHYRDILEEIDKNYEQLDKGLDAYFEPEPAAAQKEVAVKEISHPPLRIPSDDFSHTDERITDLTPYTKRALASSELRTAASQKYRTRAQLEAALKREIYRVEAPSKLDSVLGIKHPSCFYTFLHDMSVEAITQFDALPRETIKDALQKRDIPYEIYINWTDAFYDIVEIMQPPKNMKFGELFVRAELELLVDEKNDTLPK